MATGSYTCVDDWDSSQKRRKTELIFCAFLTLILVAQSERKLSWSWLQNSQNYTETWKQSHLCHRIALRWAFMQQKVFCSVYTVDCCCQFFPYFFVIIFSGFSGSPYYSWETAAHLDPTTNKRLFLSIFMSVSRNEHLSCISSRLPWDPVSYSDISPTSLGW